MEPRGAAWAVKAMKMRSQTSEPELSEDDESALVRESIEQNEKDRAFLKFTAIAIAGLVFLGVLSTVVSGGTQIVGSTQSANASTAPEQLALADNQAPTDSPDWNALRTATVDSCRTIGVNDSISYTGFGDIWIRYNEQWLTFSSGLDFSPFAQIVFEDGTQRSADDVPAWLMSDRAQVTYLLDCYEVVHPVDDSGTPTEIDTPTRVVERGGNPTPDFG